MLDVKRIAKRTIVFVPAAVILAFVVIEVRHLAHQVTITNLVAPTFNDEVDRLWS